MRKANKAELAAIKAAMPKPPDFMTAEWYEDGGEPKPQPPAGFDGLFVIIKRYSPRVTGATQ